MTPRRSPESNHRIFPARVTRHLRGEEHGAHKKILYVAVAHHFRYAVYIKEPRNNRQRHLKINSMGLGQVQ
jgi:hypothetical protein